MVCKLVSVAGTCLESCTHPRRERRCAFIGMQCRVAFQDKYEFVLLAVSMSKGGYRLRRQTRQIYAEIREPENVTKGRLTLPAIQDTKGSG